MTSQKKGTKKVSDRELRVMAGKFAAARRSLEKLPELSPLKQAIFEQNVDTEQLYYSSKIEGTHLTKDQIRDVMHG